MGKFKNSEGVESEALSSEGGVSNSEHFQVVVDGKRYILGAHLFESEVEGELMRAIWPFDSYSRVHNNEVVYYSSNRDEPLNPDLFPEMKIKTLEGEDLIKAKQEFEEHTLNQINDHLRIHVKGIGFDLDLLNEEDLEAQIKKSEEQLKSLIDQGSWVKSYSSTGTLFNFDDSDPSKEEERATRKETVEEKKKRDQEALDDFAAILKYCSDTGYKAVDAFAGKLLQDIRQKK